MLSVFLFLVSLVVPVGDGWWGWSVFASVFWMLPQALTEEPKLFVLLLTGAAANVLLFFSWAAIRVSRLQRVAPWAAGGAVLLAVASLLQVPFLGMGIGYWLWFGASFVALRTATRLRTAQRVEGINGAGFAE
jgi:hypothetical protein